MTRFLPVLLGALLAACAQSPPPVEESLVVTKPATASARPEYHVVRRGDTLYSIAFSYGLDFRGLAAANGIREPFTIYPGQRLRLGVAKPPVVAPKPAKTPATVPSAPEKPAIAKPAATPGLNGSGDQSRGAWLWPVPGQVIGAFNPNGVGPKGIALTGNPGDPVRATRAGRVVYTGSSLVGYGQLVILKHDDVYLSAYAHNSRLRVKEGDMVKAGDVLAEMGSSGADRTKLHFEVRRNGDPIDPLTVLPRR